MKRVVEPELMEDEAQAQAYAEADFEEAHSGFVREFQNTFGDHDICGCVLDLGCGPGDIAMRFARAYPQCTVHGIDGSKAMLSCGWKILAHSDDIRDRVRLIQCLLPSGNPPREQYDGVISNSLLHHLPDPNVLWNAVKRYALPGAPVFVMDLKRPASTERARELMEMYSAGEPEVLRRDFYNSLLAAFEPDEIEQQLREAGLGGMTVRETTDRHVVISGFSE